MENRFERFVFSLPYCGNLLYFAPVGFLRDAGGFGLYLWYNLLY